MIYELGAYAQHWSNHIQLLLVFMNNTHMQAIKTSKDSNSGNHSLLQGETKPFKPYKHRFFTPYRASGSKSTLWYSIKRASAYIIVMSSYSAYGKILYKLPPSLFQDDSIQNLASSSNQIIVH